MQVFDKHRFVETRAKDFGHVGRAEHQLGFEQWRTIGETGLIEVGRCVGHQEVPVPAQQVKAALFVDFEVGLCLGLTFGPDVVAPRFRVVRQVVRQIGHFAAGDAVGCVDDAAHAIGFARGCQNALELLLAVVAVLEGVDLTLERSAVCDSDFANTVFRGIDHTGGQGVLALVVDVDRGVTAGHLDLTIACADDGAGQVDDTACGLDVVEDDGAGVGIKITIHGGQARSAIADAFECVAQAVCEIAGGCRGKIFADRQFNVVHTALQGAVDIEVTRIDVDRAHGEDDRLFLNLREGGADFVIFIGVSVVNLPPIIGFTEFFHREVDFTWCTGDGVAPAVGVVYIDLVTHADGVARLDQLFAIGGLVGVTRRRGRCERVGDRVGTHSADAQHVITRTIDTEGVGLGATRLHGAQHLTRTVDEGKLVMGIFECLGGLQRHTDFPGLSHRDLEMILVKTVLQFGRDRHL